MENQLPWNIIVGSLLSIVSGLVVFYLRSIKQDLHLFSRRIDDHAREIQSSKEKCSQLATEMARCKTDCQRQFVPTENFIRSESYTRQKLTNATGKKIRWAFKCKISQNDKFVLTC